MPSFGRLIVFIETCTNEPELPMLPLEPSMMRVVLLFLLCLNVMLLFSCQATSPGDVESRLAAEAKKMKIGVAFNLAGYRRTSPHLASCYPA